MSSLPILETCARGLFSNALICTFLVTFESRFVLNQDAVNVVFAFALKHAECQNSWPGPSLIDGIVFFFDLWLLLVLRCPCLIRSVFTFVQWALRGRNLLVSLAFVWVSCVGLSCMNGTGIVVHIFLPPHRPFLYSVAYIAWRHPKLSTESLFCKRSREQSRTIPDFSLDLGCSQDSVPVSQFIVCWYMHRLHYDMLFLPLFVYVAMSFHMRLTPRWQVRPSPRSCIRKLLLLPPRADGSIRLQL